MIGDRNSVVGWQWDGGRWRPDQGGDGKYSVDVNNDQVDDFGFESGVNTWGAGSALAMNEIKDAFRAWALVVDSSHPRSGYRGYQSISGIEIENFSDTPEAGSHKYWWTGLSPSFHHLRNFTQFRDAVNDGNQPALSYGFTKEESTTFRFSGSDCDTTDLESACAGDAIFRVGFVTNQLLGLPHPYAMEGDVSGDTERVFDIFQWPEYYGGDTSVKDWNWLGAPVTDAINTPDLSEVALPSTLAAELCVDAYDLSLSTPSTTTVESTQATCTTVAGSSVAGSIGTVAQLNAMRVGRKVEISSAPDPDAAEPNVLSTYLSFAFDGSYTPDIHADCISATSAGCYKNRPIVVSFWAKGSVDYSAAALSASDVGSVGRLVTVSAILTNKKNGNTRHYPYTLLIDGVQHRPYQISLPQQNHNDQFVLTEVRFYSGEEVGSFEIDKVVVNEGQADRYYRIFDGGAVVLNAGSEDWDVEALLCSYSSSTCTVDQPEVGEWDAWVYRRDGDNWISVSSN
jgi:hypothetical protein